MLLNDHDWSKFQLHILSNGVYSTDDLRMNVVV
jgi:hypothetical protein